MQFIYKLPVGSHEITAPLAGERAVEGVINGMTVFQRDLKSGVCYGPGRDRSEGQGEQVSVDHRRPSADSSLRILARFHKALADSISRRSGAKSSISSFRNFSRRRSAAALSGSGKNHFNTTLASNTQIDDLGGIR